MFERRKKPRARTAGPALPFRARGIGPLGQSRGGGLRELTHGFKNAVHSLRGFAALLDAKVGDQPQAASTLAGLRGAIDHLADLARTFLATSPTVPAGEDGWTRHELTDVDSVIEWAVRQVEMAFPLLRCTWTGLERPSPSTVPRPILAEVLVNLLLNAAEAMQGEGRIEIGVRRLTAALAIEVRDEGAGLGRADANRLFRPGYTTKSGGSGLGLFLARKMIRAQGGNVMVIPGQERGAVFAVIVPVENALGDEGTLASGRR